MIGRIGRLAAVASTAFAFASAALAQAPELTQRHDGGPWSISYPAGWVVLGDPPFLIGTEPAMLQTVQRGAAMPEGGMAIGVLPAMVLEALGVPPSDSVPDMLFAIADQFNGDRGDAEALADWPLPAYRIAVEAGAPGETYAIAAKTPSGALLGFIVNAADVAAMLPLVRAMVASYAAE